LSAEERRRLALKGKELTAEERRACCQIVRPETILAWFRDLAAQKYDSSKARNAGHPFNPMYSAFIPGSIHTFLVPALFVDAAASGTVVTWSASSARVIVMVISACSAGSSVANSSTSTTCFFGTSVTKRPWCVSVCALVLSVPVGASYVSEIRARHLRGRQG
jgi:hypothetical protein